MHADRPTRYRDVFASGEFRALYVGSVLSWVGDYAARAAVTAMVYQHTGSPAASAAAFAVSFAPWLLGGSVLVAVAERYPYRSVMVWCDVARTAGMAVLAVVGASLGLPALFALLLLCALFAPPFEAARSATMPQILDRERYVAGVGLMLATAPPAQVIGYVAGAAISDIEPRLALALNAVTFVLSAALVRFGVRWREPALRPERRSGLLRETGDGFRLVFTNPARRALVLLVFAASLFAVVPEGLGAVWAEHRADEVGRAWAQAMIMGAVPAGMVLGALAAGRLLRPSWRRHAVRPLALATPLVLVPTIIDPPIVVAAALALAAGFSVGALVPVVNGEFVQTLPSAYRARAFGVVSAGLQVLQGFAVLAAGALAQRADLPLVVGLWSLGGVLLTGALLAAWPSPATFAEAQARAADRADEATGEAAALRAEPTVRSEPARLDQSPRLEPSA